MTSALLRSCWEHNKLKKDNHSLKISQKKCAKNLASYFFETNVIEKFQTCFDEETLYNTHFRIKMLQISGLEFDNYQGSEYLIKRMIESNKDCQLDEMKESLFKKFNIVLNDLRNHLHEDTEPFKHL